MQQVHTGENNLTQSGQQQVANHTIGTKIGCPVRHMVGAMVRTWQRRIMIALLEAMDDWLLRDIGIDRADILDVVNGFDDRELLMAPLSTRQPAPTINQRLRQSA